MEIKEINGKWTAIVGSIKITGGNKEDLQRLLNSFSDETDIPNCSECDYTPCRCSKENYEKK